MSFTIRDLENLSGIKAHTIRIWEHRYSFLKPKRTDTNIRNYTCEELKVMLNVALLNKYGYKISHINNLSETEMREKVLALTKTEAQQERIVIDLLQNMVDVDMARFEESLDHQIHTKGIEKTIAQVIFPFLEKIGVLWQTSRIIPAQEHLVSNIIRQKIAVGIENANPSNFANRSVCMFLPEKEFHELGLMFMHFLMKNQGVTVIYLGASVPMEDLEYIVRKLNPAYIYSHLTSTGQQFNLERFLNTLLRKFPGKQIIISGYIPSNHEKKIPSKIAYKKSPEEVLNVVMGEL